ncbi:hypothetical protein FAUST_11407 [Fusarium austroamericanum]|uniref:Peptidase C14 caspase domain-containing protein n=1 Tax=Fusarium austroamericanum TaxID=282268 RepID=A0AAN6BV65_FUSAU|nr:hypothetical protein FAUST_11407 [Fusarium austroamericanum]
MRDDETPRRFALLVGVSGYRNGNARRLSDGSTLLISTLKGPVNDVEGLKEFLRVQFKSQFEVISLISPPTSADNHNTSQEDAELQPTFNNIKNKFEEIESKARAGDLFYFHFSGHGGRLQASALSPNFDEDPALLTVDFGCGGRAIRGWELNQWLKRLYKKKVQVVVLLDSCYSGGAWRSDKPFRTQDEWGIIPSIPADEVFEGPPPDLGDRNSELKPSWSINPKSFTLMAACAPNERAEEVVKNGKPTGAFTHAFLQYFKNNKVHEPLISYRHLRDKLAVRLIGQTPKVYGCDRLLLFGNKEPFLVTPIIADFQDDKIILPVGTLHGVEQGSEFTFPSIATTISVTSVTDSTCSTNPLPNVLRALEQIQHGATWDVIPSRWSFGSKPFEIAVDKELGLDFQQDLYHALKDRISSEVDVTEWGSDSIHGGMLQVKGPKECIKLYGPESVIGNENLVRGLDFQGDDPDLDRKVAIALAHLGRYWQILELRDRTRENAGVFEIEMTKQEKRVPHKEEFCLKFHNKRDQKLHVSILNLGPGFHIEQLYPKSDSPMDISAGRKDEFKFSITVPENLRAETTNPLRDILRVMVTRGKSFSWKTLELPSIWDAEQMELHQPISETRNIERSDAFEWWLQDIIINTDAVQVISSVIV